MKRLFLGVLAFLAIVGAASLVSAKADTTEAEHVFNPPPGQACKTVVVAFYYEAFIDPPNILVYALDTSDMNMLQDVTELALTPPDAFSMGVERITFKHEPYVWITEADFDTVEPHSAYAFWQDCKEGG